jgi:hypothetical protein
LNEHPVRRKIYPADCPKDFRSVWMAFGLSDSAGRFVHSHQLAALQHDPNRPEDVLKVDCDEDGIGGDDCADALRYLVATKSRTVTQRKLRGVIVQTLMSKHYMDSRAAH